MLKPALAPGLDKIVGGVVIEGGVEVGEVCSGLIERK